jgi:hypothetical protein
LDESVELTAEAAAVETLWSSCDTKDARAWHCLKDFGPGAGDGMVCLIDDEELEEVRRDCVKATSEGLNAGDANGLGEVLSIASSDDAVIAADGVKGPAGLVDELLTVDEDADAIAADGSLLGDVNECISLAATGGENEEDAFVTSHERAADFSDGGGLEGTKGDCHEEA